MLPARSRRSLEYAVRRCVGTSDRGGPSLATNTPSERDRAEARSDPDDPSRVCSLPRRTDLLRAQAARRCTLQHPLFLTVVSVTSTAPLERPLDLSQGARRAAGASDDSRLRVRPVFLRVGLRVSVCQVRPVGVLRSQTSGCLTLSRARPYGCLGPFPMRAPLRIVPRLARRSMPEGWLH